MARQFVAELEPESVLLARRTDTPVLSGADRYEGSDRGVQR
ncbi:hypothetical protein [Streptomyces acidiscabies]|nr:hypothetical protein [Streptomyces acidiscabies]